MLRVIVAMMVLAMAGAASAQAMRKPCEELKAEIDAKIKKNGVAVYTLDVVDVDAQAEGKVVGTCDGNTKKIVYKRG
jgi:TRAP-type C4-dicarboxylate transport system substrate-binding protein